MEILAEGEGTLTFLWKVSSDSGDELQFLLDGVEQNYIDGEVAWQQKQYTVTGSGTHSFLWQYVKDSYDYAGEDCGWVDYVQWTGSPPSGGTSWETVTYTYDPSGRRIEKDIDGDKTTYVYDGGNVIAEYDDSGDLAGKYIHGARVDELVCMIHVADCNAVYYYHYDGLGSVVALSNSSGNSSYSYEYSAFGQPVGSDPNFTANPYLFTGRRFDYETGLYYYRARYYNPYIGRFLQTDPIGYGDGINWYAYCGNNPLAFVDPTGQLHSWWDLGKSALQTFGGALSVLASPAIAALPIPGARIVAGAALVMGANSFAAGIYNMTTNVLHNEPPATDPIRKVVSTTVSWASGGNEDYVNWSMHAVTGVEIVTATASITATLTKSVSVLQTTKEIIGRERGRYIIETATRAGWSWNVTYKHIDGTTRVLKAAGISSSVLVDIANAPGASMDPNDPNNALYNPYAGESISIRIEEPFE
jgi:RHS repeat-associated protein